MKLNRKMRRANQKTARARKERDLRKEVDAVAERRAGRQVAFDGIARQIEGKTLTVEELTELLSEHEQFASELIDECQTVESKCYLHMIDRTHINITDARHRVIARFEGEHAAADAFGFSFAYEQYPNFRAERLKRLVQRHGDGVVVESESGDVFTVTGGRSKSGAVRKPMIKFPVDAIFKAGIYRAARAQGISAAEWMRRVAWEALKAQGVGHEVDVEVLDAPR